MPTGSPLLTQIVTIEPAFAGFEDELTVPSWFIAVGKTTGNALPITGNAGLTVWPFVITIAAGFGDGTTAVICESETMSNGASVPSKDTRTPPSVVGNAPELFGVPETAVAGPMCGP